MTPILERRHIATVLVAAVGLLAAPSAVAKDFGPGDLRVCGRTQCVPIVNRQLLRILSHYYWGAGRPPRAARVRLGSPGFELRVRNGYATGMVATAKLNRFQPYGFRCGHFERGKWYRFPARAAAALAKLTAGLHPLRVSAPPRSC